MISKFTRNRKIYPNDESALKLMYVAIREESQKWTVLTHRVDGVPARSGHRESHFQPVCLTSSIPGHLTHSRRAENALR
jgi:hypothetical protein